MEQVWLIKTNQIILGPFSEQEITSYLQSKTFSKFDSVIGVNEDLWHPLNSHSYFKSIVANLDSFEPTVESTYQTHSLSGAKEVKTIELESTTIKIEPRIKKVVNAPILKMPGGIEPKIVSKNKKLSFSGLFKSSIILLGLSFAGYWGKTQWFIYQANQQGYKDLVQARENIKQFRYDSAAIKLWNTYQNDFHLLSSNDLITLTQLHLNQGKVALATEVYAKINQPSAYVEWRNWSLVGLYLKMLNKEWSAALAKAEELETAIDDDMELQFAKAYIYAQIEQYIMADQLVENLMLRYSKVQPLASFLILLKGQMFLEQIKKTTTVYVPDKEKTLNLLQDKTEKYNPYFWQMQFLALYIQAKTNQVVSSDTLATILEYNPFDADYFFAPLSLWQVPFSKQLLSDLCLDLTNALDPDHKFKELKAIELVCLHRVDQSELLDKQKKIYEKTYKNDPFINSAIALINQHSLPNNKERLPPACQKEVFWCQLAQIIYCNQSGDLGCIAESLKQAEIIKMGPSIILIEANMAKRKGDDFYSRDLITKGIQSYQNYQPLLERKL